MFCKYSILLRKSIREELGEHISILGEELDLPPQEWAVCPIQPFMNPVMNPNGLYE